jgi:hypothetical protein
MKNSKGDSAANCSLKHDISLRHLQAELARLDILLQREVRRWQIAGQDPADPFRLCAQGIERLADYSSFRNEAPLIKHNLVTLSKESNTAFTILLSRAIHLDEIVLGWLLGE